MKSIKRIIGNAFILAVAASIAGCDGNDGYEPAEIVRLDMILESGAVPADVVTKAAGEKWFAVSGYGVLTDSSLAVYNANPSIVFHRKAVGDMFSYIDDVKTGLGNMLGRMKADYPAVHQPRLFAVISPFNQSVVTVDSVMYLGLNHYLGVNYEAYSYFPDYVRINKKRERIVPDVAEALIRQYYPYKPDSEYPTTLSILLYEGAVVEAVARTTEMSEQDALGIDGESYGWLEANEKEMWNALIIKKLLYSTDEAVGEMLVRQSAVTSLLHPEAPGRAGRFIGHRIVLEYLKHNAEEPHNLLLPQFYDSRETLARSKYH